MHVRRLRSNLTTFIQRNESRRMETQAHNTQTIGERFETNFQVGKKKGLIDLIGVIVEHKPLMSK